MLAYAMLGTNDKDKALSFYDAVLGEMGYERTMDFGRSVAYGSKDKPHATALAIGMPLDDKPATSGNGTMIAIAGGSEAKIKAAYDRALALGGRDEGKPGPRGDGFYAAYFRDLDGNKICLCKF
jgi:catechol 2,3-dioxygenase-like lactoylglutathione lyase family enzyme